MGKTTKYAGISGTIFYSVSEDDPIETPIYNSSYYITITVENLHLYNADLNDEIIIENASFWNVYVGWMPG